MACVQLQDTLTSVSLSLSTLLNLQLRNTLHARMVHCIDLFFPVPLLMTCKLLQPAEPMLGADERAYFVRKWNQVIPPWCNRKFLLNVIEECTAMLPCFAGFLLHEVAAMYLMRQLHCLASMPAHGCCRVWMLCFSPLWEP